MDVNYLMINNTMKSKIAKVIKNPWLIVSLFASKITLRFIPDKPYLKFLYYAKMKNKLNLDKPQTFNEKLQWLKIHDRNSEYIKWVDKYEVRNYIANTLGEKYLIPVIGVWDNFDQIDFNELPDQFVLKTTHDSGSVIICKDKKQFDSSKARKILQSALKKNYYYYAREWPYKNVKPRIICEEYMVDESGEEVKDYKLMCFNGEVKCSFVCLNRNSTTGLNVDFYDTNWEKMPFERHYPNSNEMVSKPKNYVKMVKFAEKLSKCIPFVRVDFYEINDQLYFGELTLYPGSGFEEFTPESYDHLLGSWIKLPNNKST